MSSNNICAIKNERRHYKKFVKSFKFSEADMFYLCETYVDNPSFNNEKYLKYAINNCNSVEKVTIIKIMKKHSIDWKRFV